MRSKLSFNSKTGERGTKKKLNNSLDEDYEFYDSDDESTDEEMNENMKRLVDKEKDDGLGDSGYSEDGYLKSATKLDHSYSRSIHSLVRPHSKRESKGVAALLHLANAASKELRNLSKSSQVNRNVTETVDSQSDLFNKTNKQAIEPISSKDLKDCSKQAEGHIPQKVLTEVNT